MKRVGNLYHKIIDVKNLRVAATKASRGKRLQPGVISFQKAPERLLTELNVLLKDFRYKTSDYTIFKVYEPKEREIHRLPFYPDRITHHAIMNVLEPIFLSTFTADTYSCIKGKGIHAASRALKKALRDTKMGYCLKLDIKKYYGSINHEILKGLIRRKFKDPELLWLIDEVIDSAPGLPIGNYLSQYLANFYLTFFDHWIKQTKSVTYYYRYCDDLVILGENKPFLHQLRVEIAEHLNVNLKLEVKKNYRVFPVTEGIDFVGYVHYPTHTMLRKSIKKNMARAVSNNAEKSVASYYGWAKHCNSKNLLKKLNMNKFSDFGIKPRNQFMEGEKISIHKILNREIKVISHKIEPSKFMEKGNGKCLHLQIEVAGEKRVLFTGSTILMESISQVPINKFPFSTTIVKDNDRLMFT